MTTKAILQALQEVLEKQLKGESADNCRKLTQMVQAWSGAS